ncbi:MAG: transposase [Methylovulum sp.]|nr:transposase [Methylovulum sp.]MDD2725450.1 transposase [Methylovulum sp.]MDD5125182.1 transposase [Methylovulum sp.]
METSITIKQLVSETRCYAAIRQLRWADGVTCPHLYP